VSRQMASVKKTDDLGDEHVPVPPYPAEVSRTWQAFRVTLRDDDAAGDKPDAPREDAPRSN
jgi:hypothetical protein